MHLHVSYIFYGSNGDVLGVQKMQNFSLGYMACNDHVRWYYNEIVYSGLLHTWFRVLIYLFNFCIAYLPENVSCKNSISGELLALSPCAVYFRA